MTPKDIARYEWLLSQENWHREARQRAKTHKQRCWHVAQKGWYADRINSLPGLFTWIVTETFKKHSVTIAASLTKKNTLLQRMLLGRT